MGSFYRVVGVIADGYRVNCNHLIMSSEYVPASVTSKGDEKWIDRAVYITNKSIWTEEKEHVSFVLVYCTKVRMGLGTSWGNMGVSPLYDC